jgi:hypothetical protein
LYKKQVYYHFCYSENASIPLPIVRLIYAVELTPPTSMAPVVALDRIAEFAWIFALFH